MKLFSPDSTHWYQRDGVPLHSVTSAKGEPRPTTLRDARKLGLLPSVTNVLGVIAKPELTAWLQEQAVMAALTLPRIAGETEDAFAKRVVADSQTTRDGAADFGTAFHHGAERVAKTLEVDSQHPAAAWLVHYRDWYQANAFVLRWTEKVLVHPEGCYAGTADLLIEHPVHGLTLVDLKTMKFPTARGDARPTDGRPAARGDARPTNGRPAARGDSRPTNGRPAARGDSRPTNPKPYKSWCYQLAAYRYALGQPVKCMNLIVNSIEPSAPVEHVWSDGEMQAGWLAFKSAYQLWVIEKNYDPAGVSKDEG